LPGDSLTALTSGELDCSLHVVNREAGVQKSEEANDLAD
jgi:hypothetical protein